MFKSQILIVLALVLTACGSDESVDTMSTSTPESVGGSNTSSTSTSTVASVAGASSTMTTATGGSSTNVAGTSSIIGTGKTGGSSAVTTNQTGGSSSSTATGGSAPQASGGSDPGAGGSAPQAAGGSSATGGSSGRTPPGGSSSTGGKTSTGGSTPQATGGSTTTTTTAAGGDPSTGGSSTTTTTATGGSSTTTTTTTGGTSTTIGGSNPGNGGNSATGGSSTTTTGGSTSVPAPVPTQVSVGTFHTCTVLSDGHVKCWGVNTYGQLGNGTTTESPTPVVVSGISNAVQVSNSTNHTCALLANGTVKCWGENQYGQLGNGVATIEAGTLTPNPNPVQVIGVTGALQVSVSGYTTCILLSDHTVKCVGFGGFGGLGDGTQSTANYYSKTLVQVSGINNATAVSSGSNYSCALLSDKTIKCWGRPTHGEFATESNGKANTPVSLPDISNATQLSVGENNICYLADTNQAFCWGTQNNSTTPVLSLFSAPYSGISLLATKLMIGMTHGCGVYSRPELTAALVVQCWGSNTFGELGDGTTVDKDMGVVVPSILDATDVAVGANESTCAILKSGTMKCWGQLTGNSSSPTSSTPVTPDGF